MEKQQARTNKRLNEISKKIEDMQKSLLNIEKAIIFKSQDYYIG